MIYTIFVIFALFCLLLNPAFVFLGGKHVSLLLWPLAICWFNRSVRERFFVHTNLFRIWFILLLYVVLRTLMGGDPKFLIAHFFFLLDIFISYIVVYLAIKKNVDFINTLLITASIAGIISCLCLFVPSIHEYLRNIQVINNDYLLEVSYRGFGVGEGLTFTYGVVLGLICALGICNIKKHVWFLFFIPFVAVAVLVNARIGFFPIMIALFLFLGSEHKISYVLYLFIFLCVLWIAWEVYIKNYFPGGTLEWIKDFFTQIGEGTEGGTVGALLNNTIWPEDLFEWLCGKGRDVFDPSKAVRTDIGYLIQLCYGGILYCLLLFLFVWAIFTPAYKAIPVTYMITLCLSIALVNYKGPFLSRNPAFLCLIIIVIYYAQIKENKQ